MTPGPVGSGRNPMQSREGRRGRDGPLWRQDQGNGPGRETTARFQGMSGPADGERGRGRRTGDTREHIYCLSRAFLLGGTFSLSLHLQDRVIRYAVLGM